MLKIEMKKLRKKLKKNLGTFRKNFETTLES